MLRFIFLFFTVATRSIWTNNYASVLWLCCFSTLTCPFLTAFFTFSFSTSFPSFMEQAWFQYLSWDWSVYVWCVRCTFMLHTHRSVSIRGAIALLLWSFHSNHSLANNSHHNKLVSRSGLHDHNVHGFLQHEIKSDMGKITLVVWPYLKWNCFSQKPGVPVWQTQPFKSLIIH